MYRKCIKIDLTVQLSGFSKLHTYTILFILVRPFIIEDTFIHCNVVLAPESFTISVEFVIICMDFNVTWQFNGRSIINGSNHVIVNNDLSSSRYRTSVKIIQSSLQDSGTYTMTVTTAVGNDSANITVEVISKFIIYIYYVNINCTFLSMHICQSTYVCMYVCMYVYI